ncbi:hypothetical protein ACSV9I_01365 [Rhizobium sp. G187]|uniref:hypothetical protein n=1 Tax=Rhizobium sp. G187 TaxID=3451352 RepID=UPI003EE62196
MFRTLQRDKILTIALVTTATFLVCALAFIGWMQHGSAIFISLIDSGLAYCL